MAARVWSSLCWREDAKIVPYTAIPVAMPIWRKVVLTPEAIPERWGVTTPTAVEASGGCAHPRPGAGHDEAGDEVGPGARSVEPGHKQQADPDQKEAGTDEPTDRHVGAEPPSDRRRYQGHPTHDQKPEARPEGRVTKVVL